MVPCADMPSLPTPAGWMESVRSYHSIDFGLPRNRGGSSPALTFSRPAQRSLTLRPACSPSRLNDLLNQRLQQSRCLHRCSDCYRVERTSSRAGLTLAVDHHLFTAHAVIPFTRSSAYIVAKSLRFVDLVRVRNLRLPHCGGHRHAHRPDRLALSHSRKTRWWRDGCRL